MRHTHIFSMVTLVGCLLTSAGCSWFQTALPRIDDRPTPHPDHLVNLGDVLDIEHAAVRDELQRVTWSQKGKEVHDDYYVVNGIFQNPRTPDAPPVQVPVFVQANFMTYFEEGCAPTARKDVCGLTVTSRFRYGQDAEKTMRFLVYHDPNYTPFQHRFIDTDMLAILTKLGYRSAKTVLGETEEFIPYGGLLLKAGEATSELISATFGDQLWLFDDEG